jgi:hypothetical protein
MVPTTSQKKPRQDRRLVQGAQRYALADRSDPFVFNRAMTHIGNGIATMARARDDVPHNYDAEAAKETRKLPDGTPYEVTVYKNMRRP